MTSGAQIDELRKNFSSTNKFEIVFPLFMNYLLQKAIIFV